MASGVNATGADVGSLETSLRSLVGQVRSQLEVLQRDNDAKDREIDQYKVRVLPTMLINFNVGCIVVPCNN